MPPRSWDFAGALENSSFHFKGFRRSADVESNYHLPVGRRGHAGWNETAFVQAVDPTLVHAERYRDELATAYPAPGTWSAAPFPSSIGLYQPGQGLPRFDQKKADEYFTKVTDKVAILVSDVIRKWDAAGL